MSEPKQPMLAEAMRAVWLFAKLEFRESWDRRLVWIPVILGLALALLPSGISMLCLGKNGFERLSKDIALQAILYPGLAFAVYLGSTIISKDFSRKTLEAVLCKPVHRMSLVLGKILAGFLLLTASQLLPAVGFLAGVHYCNPNAGWDFQVLWGALCQSLASTLLFSSCCLASTRYSPALSGVMGGFCYTLGSLSKPFLELITLQDRSNPLVFSVAIAGKSVLPRYELFDVSFCVVHRILIPDGYVAGCILYCFSWVIFLALMSQYILSKKDL
jgi:ABC-type transport system involved in multi-copper enzyme maturation permease subunit